MKSKKKKLSFVIMLFIPNLLVDTRHGKLLL